MLQEQGRFVARIREQVWLLTCCCPFPFFYTSGVRWAVPSCVVEEKGNSAECGKTLYLFCLEWHGNLMSYWQYFLVSGGWKAGSLIWMLIRPRMWQSRRRCARYKLGWGLGDFGLGPKIGSCFLRSIRSSKICHRWVGQASLCGETKITFPPC